VHAAAAGLLRTALGAVRLLRPHVRRVGETSKPFTAAKFCLLRAACDVPPVSARLHRPDKSRRHGTYIVFD